MHLFSASQQRQLGVGGGRGGRRRRGATNREWRRVRPMAEFKEFAEAPGRQRQMGRGDWSWRMDGGPEGGEEEEETKRGEK